MAIRSHLGRSMDFRLQSNRLILGIAVVFSAAGVWLWLTTDDTATLWAGVHAALGWSMMREIDPDHNWSALLVAAVAGVWVLAGLPIVSAFVAGALMLAARYVVNTTGRRPLPVDYIATGVLGVAVAYLPLGWVAGSGIAIAMYVDDRMADQQRPIAIAAALLAAVGASVVATASTSFPDTVPDVRPVLLLGIGLLALIAVLRPPPVPTSLCDSRLKIPIRQDRLHATRALLALLLFAMAFLAGPEAASVGPAVIGLTVALIADETARFRSDRR